MKTGQGPARRPGARSPTATRSSSRRRPGPTACCSRRGTSRATSNAALAVPGARRRRRGRLGPGRARQGRAGAVGPRLPLHRPARLPAGPAGRAAGHRPRGRRTASTRTCPRPIYRLEVTDSRGRQIVAPAGDALGVRHLPRDAAARRRGARRHLPRPALPAGQERVRRPVRGPGVPARDDRPGLRPQEDGLLPRRDDRGRRRRASTSTAPRSPNRPIAVQPARRPDRCTARPTPAGKYHVEFPTEGFAEEQALRLVAQLPQDNVAAAASVMLAVRAFRSTCARPATSTSTASRSGSTSRPTTPRASRPARR